MNRLAGRAVYLLACFASLAAHGQLFQQGPKLVGNDAVGAANQSAVAVSADGNTAIFGGSGDNGNTGAAWIFVRVGGVWIQQGPKLVGSGASGAARQGAVAISADGNTAVIGGAFDNTSTGAVWVFTRSGGVWTQQGPKLVGTGATIFAMQGSSVAISGDGNTLLSGAPLDSVNMGAVFVFTRSGGVWTQQGPKLVSSSPITPARQGQSVAISNDGNTAIIGAPGDLFNQGAAYVFTRSGGVWTQQSGTLTPNDATPILSFLFAGATVAMSADGNTAAMGGQGDGNNDGAAWVFTRSGGVWTQQGNKIVGSGASAFALQGSSVALSPDGNTLVSGGRDDALGAGAMWVFKRSGGVWTQLGGKLVGSGAVGPLTASQGTAVAAALNGDTVFSGGPRDNNNAGADWVFAVAADLAITQSASRNNFPGTLPYSYTLNVSNAGPATATNVTVTDTLPAGATFVSASGSGWSCAQAAGMVTCTMPSLGVAAAAPITINLLAPPVAGNAINTATVASDAVDPNPSNNTSTSTVVLLSPGLIPVLSPWLLALLALMLASIAVVARHD